MMLQWRALLELVKNDIEVEHKFVARMRKGCNWYIEVLQKAHIFSPLLVCVCVCVCACVCVRARNDA